MHVCCPHCAIWFCQQEAQREQEEKQRKKDSQAAEGEEQQHAEEEEAATEAQAAKGNSVFDAPVPNLAAGVQLGFTPSSAGGPATSLCYIVSLQGLKVTVDRHAYDVQPCSSTVCKVVPKPADGALRYLSPQLPSKVCLQ